MDMMAFLGALKGKGLNPEELNNFMRSQVRNQYVDIGPYSAYLRKSRRVLPSGDYTRTRSAIDRPTLDLANIDRTDVPGTIDNLPPEQRPKGGKFRDLMALLEQTAGQNNMHSVYVENVLNKFLPDVLQRYGYTPDLIANRGGINPPSFYKELER